MLLGTGSSPALAAPGGNAAASAQCLKGGYRNFATSEAITFRNEGQCISYAVQGGSLHSLPILVVYFISTGETVRGAGLKPGTDVTYTWNETSNTYLLGTVEPDGTFELIRDAGACPMTNVVATATKAGAGTLSSEPGSKSSYCP